MKPSTIVVVNMNGKQFLKSCFNSLLNMDYDPKLLELIMIDNGSTDGSVEYIKKFFPQIKILANNRNNFARALNLGIRESSGNYIGFLVYDMVVDKKWLIELVKILNKDNKIGCVGGKVLFKDGKINSIGIKKVRHFHFEYKGFKEKDRHQYDKIMEVENICGSSVLYRRKCLEDVGSFDEDYIMGLEDVDMSTKCYRKGWNLVFTPYSIAYRESNESREIIDNKYYDRNRLIYIAKHYPKKLPRLIKKSYFYINNNIDQLYTIMPLVVRKLIKNNNMNTICRVLPKLSNTLKNIFGIQIVDNLLARLEVSLDYRKLRIGIYDHALHLIGGGQKYGCTIAEVLQDNFDITFISNKEVSHKDLKEWYNLDLSKCKIKVIKIPFYEKKGRNEIDHGMIISEMKNPFHIISKESGNYDIFINNCMLEMVYPLSNISLFICHFPERQRSEYFYVDRYTHLIFNSKYSAEWVKKKWKVAPTKHIYPPVDMVNCDTSNNKEGIILSVARFEVGGSKQQVKMIEAFENLCQKYPERLRNWRLILVGGSIKNNPYLEKIRKKLNISRSPIELKVNIPLDELKSLYRRAKIFWHTCGLAQTEPQLIEHFGMTTVEAMQNGCVPIVFNGGGQKEIVENGVSGFRFDSLEDLIELTVKVIDDQDLFNCLSQGARKRGEIFSKRVFEKEVKIFFQEIFKNYCSFEMV